MIDVTDPADPRPRVDPSDPAAPADHPDRSASSSALDRPEPGDPLDPPPAPVTPPVETTAPATPVTLATGAKAVGPAGPQSAQPPVVPRTRAGALWVAIVGAILVLVLLIIFIAQNLATVGVHFLGLYGQISLGLALLIAAVFGAALTVVVGTARILQLRHVARRNRDLEPRRGR